MTSLYATEIKPRPGISVGTRPSGHAETQAEQLLKKRVPHSHTRPTCLAEASQDQPQERITLSTKTTHPSPDPR